MVNTPLIVSGKVYDVDGITVIEGATVTLENASNKTDGISETISAAPTNSAGEYTLQAANLTTSIAASDILFLRVNSGKKSCEVLAKLSAADIIAGIWDQDLYLRNMRQISLNNGGTCSLIGVHCGNITSFAQKIWILSRTAASSVPYDIVACIPVDGDSNGDLDFNKPILIDGGIRVIQTADSSAVDPATLTTGLSNAIGDISKQKVIVTICTG